MYNFIKVDYTIYHHKAHYIKIKKFFIYIFKNFNNKLEIYENITPKFF